MLKCASFVVEKAVYCLSKFLPLSLQPNCASLFKIPGGSKVSVPIKDVDFFSFSLGKNEWCLYCKMLYGTKKMDSRTGRLINMKHSLSFSKELNP